MTFNFDEAKQITAPLNYSDDISHDIGTYHDDLARREEIWEKTYNEELKTSDIRGMVEGSGISIFDNAPDALVGAVESGSALLIGQLFLEVVKKETEEYARRCANRESGLEK